MQKRSNIRYPKGIQINNSLSKTSGFSAAGRGMELESLINQANEYYLSQGLASIHKKPTPIQIVKVDYKKRATAKITEAYFSTPSTTDYNGIYKGYYIDFEAKQTKLKSLPFHNFHEHQINHMDVVIKQNGICFVILDFQTYEQTFIIEAKYIIDFFRSAAITNKKSFSLADAQKLGYKIEMTGYPLLNYLKIIEKKLIGGAFVDNQK